MYGVAHCMCLQFWHSNDSCLSVKLLRVVDIIIHIHILCTYSYGNETVPYMTVKVHKGYILNTVFTLSKDLCSV